MTSRTEDNSQRTGFTLVELLLVMALLTIVIAVVAPSLSRFFHARNVDHEARRFLALTRYAQSRAVAEGVPMILWIDTEARTYGLHAEAGYVVDEDTMLKRYDLDAGVKLLVTLPDPVSLEANQFPQPLTANRQQSASMMEFRFQPDGFIPEDSPVLLEFCEGENRDGATKVALSRSRLNYEIPPRNL